MERHVNRAGSGLVDVVVEFALVLSCAFRGFAGRLYRDIVNRFGMLRLSLQPLCFHAGHQLGCSALDFVELIGVVRGARQIDWSLRVVRCTIIRRRCLRVRPPGVCRGVVVLRVLLGPTMHDQ